MPVEYSPPPPTPTPPQYTPGCAKQDPQSKAVAVRTSITDPSGYFDWGVMTVSAGGHFATWDEVVDWPDMVHA